MSLWSAAVAGSFARRVKRYLTAWKASSVRAFRVEGGGARTRLSRSIGRHRMAATKTGVRERRRVTTPASRRRTKPKTAKRRARDRPRIAVLDWSQQAPYQAA